MNRTRELRRALFADLLATAPFQPATNYWRSVELAAVLDHGLPTGLGLDLGCGDGALMRVLLAHAGPRELVGVDLDPAETKAAAASGAYARIHTGSAAAVPEPDGSFDFVFSNSVLEHIPDIDAVLHEAARLLRPGGSFLFTVPGPGFHDCLRGPLRPFVTRERYLAAVDRRCAHLRYWGAAQWQSHLDACGLKVTATVAYLTRGETRRWETLSRFTAGLLYALAGGRSQPIDIQRRLRMRSGVTLPAPLARLVARVLAAGVPGHVGELGESDGACLLLLARKAA